MTVIEGTLEYPLAGDDLRAEFASRMAGAQDRVLRPARGVLGDRGEAEEVAQEAFLRAYRRYRSLREPGSFRAWVCRISLRLAPNRRRANLRSRARDATWLRAGRPQVVDGSGVAERHMELGRLRESVARLPRKLRDALLLTAVGGLSSAEAGDVLGVPEGTVRSRVHTARRRLLGELMP